MKQSRYWKYNLFNLYCTHWERSPGIKILMKITLHYRHQSMIENSRVVHLSLTFRTKLHQLSYIPSTSLLLDVNCVSQLHTVGATFMPWNFRTCIWVQTLHQWNLQYGQVQLISHTITGYHLPKARCTIFLAFVMHTKRTAFTSYSCNKLQNLQYHIVCLSKNHKISECNASA